MDNNKEAIRFIDRLYRDLYLSNDVLNHSTGAKTDKFRNLKEYFDAQEDLHQRARTLEHRKKILKELYHARYVIKPENIPESYYQLQKEIAISNGKGYLDIDKKKIAEEVIKNQEESLDRWIDYSLSDDAKMFSFWAKYWAFQGMLKLGSFNEEKMVFNKRNKNTTAPFAELNIEALSQSIFLIMESLNKKGFDDKKLQLMVRDGSFQMIYAYFLDKEMSKEKQNEGIWVKYNKGGDYKKLAHSLNGYKTNWCTKGEGTAEAQLSYGDFYVYYTLDDNNEYKVPRIAIRMEEDHIAEIRGVALSQSIEPEMQKVVEEKLKEFPDRDEYYQKVKNMEKLTKIYKKQLNHIELTLEELRFLYEIDDYIIGFGHKHDPRIREILSRRDIYSDLSKIFNHDVKEREEKFINGISKGVAMKKDDPLFPKAILRYLPFMEKLDNMTFPEIYYGDIHLGGTEMIKNTRFPKRINAGIRGEGDLHVGVGNNNAVFENVIFPHEVSGDFNVSGSEMKNVVLPQIIHGNVSIKVKTYSDLILPDVVDGTFKLDIPYAKNVILPKIIRKAITISSLGPAIESIKFPEVCWSVEMPKIVYGTGLILPRMLQDDLILSKLSIADNIILPVTVGGDLNLCELTDGRNLVLPSNVGENVDLRSLIYMEGMVLPKRISGSIHISSIALDYFKEETIESIVDGNIYVYNEEKRCVNSIRGKNN